MYVIILYCIVNDIHLKFSFIYSLTCQITLDPKNESSVIQPYFYFNYFSNYLVDKDSSVWPCVLTLMLCQMYNSWIDIYYYEFSVLVGIFLTWYFCLCFQSTCAQSSETGPAVLLGLSWAHSNSSASTENCFCDAGVHAVWVRAGIAERLRKM